MANWKMGDIIASKRGEYIKVYKLIEFPEVDLSEIGDWGSYGACPIFCHSPIRHSLEEAKKAPVGAERAIWEDATPYLHWEVVSDGDGRGLKWYLYLEEDLTDKQMWAVNEILDICKRYKLLKEPVDLPKNK